MCKSLLNWYDSQYRPLFTLGWILPSLWYQGITDMVEPVLFLCLRKRRPTGKCLECTLPSLLYTVESKTSMSYCSPPAEELISSWHCSLTALLQLGAGLSNFHVGMHCFHGNREVPSFPKEILEKKLQNSLTEVRISMLLKYYCAYNKSSCPAVLSFWKEEWIHEVRSFLARSVVKSVFTHGIIKT